MKEICNATISSRASLKRAAGIVMAVSKGSVSANVVLTGSTAIISLPNKTGQILGEGDHVWINYWQSINDGYIALKVGDGEYGLGSSSASTISIDNAFLLREGSHEYITTHSYEVTDDFGTAKFYIPEQGAVGTVSRTDQFGDGSYLYESSLQLSSGQIVINQDFATPPQYLMGNNFHMYQSLSIQSYILFYDGVHSEYLLDTKYMYFADDEISEGDHTLYMPELIISASEHEAERHYPLMATYGSDPSSSEFRIVLEPGVIGYRPEINPDSLVASINIWTYKHHPPEAYNPNDYWYIWKNIDYNLMLPLVSTFVDTNTYTGTVTDTKERRVVT